MPFITRGLEKDTFLLKRIANFLSPAICFCCMFLFLSMPPGLHCLSHVSVSQSVQKGRPLWSNSIPTAQIKAQPAFSGENDPLCKLPIVKYLKTAGAAAAFTARSQELLVCCLTSSVKAYWAWIELYLTLYMGTWRPMATQGYHSAGRWLKGKPSFPVPLPGSDLQSAD